MVCCCRWCFFLTRRYWPLADSTDSIAGKRGRSNKKVDLGAAATYGKEQNVSPSACVAYRAIILTYVYTIYISFLREMKIEQRWRCQQSRLCVFRRSVHILIYFVFFSQGTTTKAQGDLISGFGDVSAGDEFNPRAGEGGSSGVTYCLSHVLGSLSWVSALWFRTTRCKSLNIVFC